MPRITKILIRQLVTEKTTRIKDAHNKYAFEVALNASQHSVAEDVAKKYKVDVLGVNLMIMPGKKRRLLKKQRFIRLPKWKKAIVELKEGQKIEDSKVDKKVKANKKVNQGKAKEEAE